MKLYIEADSGVVTDAELDEITYRHVWGVWLPHEMRLSKWEI